MTSDEPKVIGGWILAGPTWLRIADVERVEDVPDADAPTCAVRLAPSSPWVHVRCSAETFVRAMVSATEAPRPMSSLA